MPVLWPDVPKVTVSDAGVTCHDCHKTISCYGTHFLRIHGVPRMGQTRRLRAFGLPLGTRWAAKGLREKHRDMSIADGRRLPLAATRRAWVTKRHYAGIEVSAAVKRLRAENMLRSARPRMALLRQVRCRVAMTCEWCRFTLCVPSKTLPRRFCSREHHVAAKQAGLA